MIDTCQDISNITIVCQDGNINSHKLVVASLSLFVKSFISEIQANDSIAVFLPDFKKKDVENLIKEVVLKESLTTQLGRYILIIGLH